MPVRQSIDRTCGRQHRLAKLSAISEGAAIASKKIWG
jgi:hypothetical protein